MTGQADLETITEENLLELIKGVAILSVDPVVHCVKFQSVKQENVFPEVHGWLEGETITLRLHGGEGVQLLRQIFGEPAEETDSVVPRQHGGGSDDHGTLQPRALHQNHARSGEVPNF